MSFKELGLSNEVLKALEDSGYTEPTPIQQKAIPYVLMGRDVLGCAQTGTGKTAGFTLPMIEVLAEGKAKARMPRSLILAPTRELAAQVAESFERYGKYHKLSKALLTGGSSMADQQKKLDRGVDVLIATPGRLIDLFERGKILLADVKILVIDEADRMLDMGFIPDVERIVSLLPTIRQTLFFSATMPKEIRRLADKFLLNPKEISVAPPASPAETVEQGLVRCPGQDKRKALQRLLDRDQVQSGLIFCNRKRDVAALAKALKKQGYSADELHGDMAQPMRTETLERFRNGEFAILVCSDVAARGLDIPAVSHVFNYDVPGHPEDYVHRIGRTGRAGRKGKAYTLATPACGKALAGIEKMLKKAIPPVQIDDVRTLPVEKVEGELPAGAAPADPAEAPAVQAEDKAAEAQPSETKPQNADGKGRRRGGRGRKAKPAEPQDAPADAAEETAPAQAANANVKPAGKAKPSQAKGRGGKSKGRGEAQEQVANGRQSKPFGDHTPAFLLRPVPQTATA